MSHIQSRAASVIVQCRRFTVSQILRLKAKASTAQILGVRNAGLTSTYVNVLGASGTLRARALKGLRASRLRLACSVVLAIGIALSIPMADADSGSLVPYRNLKELANYQLPSKQESCHHEIVHRESSWRAQVRNGSHTGYYQGRSEYLIDKPYDVQFYWYWSYVSNRYGHDDEVPNYCAALNHLVTKGWQ